MPGAVALAWELLARDQASPAFLRVAGAADKAATATARSAAAMKKSADSSEAAAAKMSAVGAKLTKGLTLPLLGIAAVSLKMAGDFQQSTNVLVTAAGESVKNLGLIRKGILDIATTTGTSWKQVTDGMYVLEKAGYRGAAALKVEKAAAQGAREEGASLATVTQALTSIMASYHIPASKAVSVMNQLKTAAGEAKVTQEQYAGSLAAVLPLASANKIAFADLAGNLATLTQHGTSADEATQELAFTIRGLSAPNAVAIKEMAQLGISSVDVAKRLGDGPGGRGLAGTLKYLSDVVHKRTGKDGLVLLSTFNASKIAAKDAQIEYSHLGTEAQKLATGFKNGTITQKDWTAGLKTLTPAQASLAKQFAVTENAAKGFQSTVRGGISQSQTASDALKKMAGGANGLNTILQTTGESAQGTAERIKRVKEAAGGAGKDVSGWASTQKLFNVQLDMFKQKLAATAIQIGTDLLPVFTKVVSSVSGAVKAFDGLSSTQKKVMAWSVGILFAAGPVLGLGGKLIRLGTVMSRASVGISAALTRIAGASFTTSARVNTAVGGMTAALGGAGIGLMVGSLTRHASSTVKALGIIGSAAAGAALGFGAGGPIGAALGGLGGLIGGAVSSLGLFGGAAKAQIKPTQELTQAILDDGNAFGKLTAASVRQSLESKGLYDAALKVGVTQRTLTNASLGNHRALKLVAAATASGTQAYNANLKRLTALNAASSRQVSALTLQQRAYSQLTDSQRATYDAAKALAGGFGDVQTMLAVNRQAADNETLALGVLGSKALTAAQNAAILKAAIDQLHSKTITLTTIMNYEKAVGINPTSTHSLSGSGDRKPTASGSRSVFGRADGTIPPNTTFTVGEGASHTWEGGHADAHGRVTIWSNKQSKAMGFRTPVGYARGSKPDQGTLSSNASSAIGDVGSAYSAKFNVADVGIDRIRHQLAHAWDVLNAQIAKGLSSNAAKKYKAELHAYTELAQKQLASLRVKISTTDISSIRHAFGTSAQDLKDAFTAILADAKLAGKSLKPYQQAESALLDKQKSYLAASTRQAGMKTYQGGIRSTLSGAFDPTQYGSVTDLIGGLGGAAGKNNKYASQLNKLHKETKGNKTLTAFINQLAASGDTATLTTLAGASKSDLGKVSTAVDGYNTSLTAGSQAATLEKYNTSVAAQTTATDKLRHDMNKLAAALNHPKPIHVHLHVDKEEIASKVFESDTAGDFLEEFAHHVRSGRRG